MDVRGKSRWGFRKHGRSGRCQATASRMRPERYFETLLREVARKINYIYRLAGRHFEAKKFCLDLEALVKDLFTRPPRRA